MDHAPKTLDPTNPTMQLLFVRPDKCPCLSNSTPPLWNAGSLIEICILQFAQQFKQVGVEALTAVSIGKTIN